MGIDRTTQQAKMKTVLVVDDQQELRRLVMFTLNKRYRVLEAGDAGEAYAMISVEPPDLLILDIMMPGAMDGIQLCEKLRHEDGLWSLPILILTARAQQADHAAGTRAGADIYMTKPFSPTELLVAVQSLLG